MSFDRWWPFLLTVLVVSGTPGPNMLHVMARAARFGVVRSLWSMAGCLTAVLTALALSALGVGALLAAMPRLFDALRYAGAAYLVYLGVKSWWAAGRGAMPDEAAATVPPRLSGPRLFRDGLFVGLSNPKLILFAGALFPQFIRRDAPWAPQFGLLVATFVTVECGWYLAYALGGRRLAGWLKAPGRQRGFDRATGALFIAFGTALIAARA
ncbi:LysE family translocator [Sphingomonas morindae]|uniref:LysE family translocator n=1 Tax=Sphingomonas morindae TaxID=1541170 RepID=A0ABY4X6Z1_9SPHN|nr:LysE family translocator [Sphingomonas morindae]USI72672.1 LysE family translocator [Sphingomonas morindae]